jgi:hypothetical protein
VCDIFTTDYIFNEMKSTKVIKYTDPQNTITNNLVKYEEKLVEAK